MAGLRGGLIHLLSLGQEDHGGWGLTDLLKTSSVFCGSSEMAPSAGNYSCLRFQGQNIPRQGRLLPAPHLLLLINYSLGASQTADEAGGVDGP